jgi:hypothetical protein
VKDSRLVHAQKLRPGMQIKYAGAWRTISILLCTPVEPGRIVAFLDVDFSRPLLEQEAVAVGLPDFARVSVRR